MKMSNRGSLLSTTAAIGLAGLLACATEAEDPGHMPAVEDLDEGLTIIEANPTIGVVGAYREANDVIYFETRVGYIKPEIHREAYPDEPAEEIDLRFVDKNGIGFYFQRGGDEFVDPTWADSFQEALRYTAPDEDRIRDFALAKAAGQAFPLVAEPALVDHTFHMRSYGERLTPSEDPVMVARAEAIMNEPLPQVANKNWSGGTTPAGDRWWWLEADMYHSSVAAFGTHGAVALWAWPNGGSSWQLAMNACNHGTCAGAGSYQCTTVGGWHWAPTFSGETSTSTGTVSGGCSTGYNWGDVFFEGDEHNSNDDAAYELWQAKEGTTSTSRGNSVSFDWRASNKRYACKANGMRWTAPANCP